MKRSISCTQKKKIHPSSFKKKKKFYHGLGCAITAPHIRNRQKKKLITRMRHAVCYKSSFGLEFCLPRLVVLAEFRLDFDFRPSIGNNAESCMLFRDFAPKRIQAGVNTTKQGT